MNRVFFRTELEGTATFWRIERRDGVALGFTSHDRDLWIDGLLHRAAPGMLPSAVCRTAGLTPDSVDIEGALAHDAIGPADLAAGRYDGAAVQLGILDWETGDTAVLYRGEIGTISEQGAQFSAELVSAKALLAIDAIPRTSPTCRAEFCGEGCSLSAARFTHDLGVVAVDIDLNAIALEQGPGVSAFRDGQVRWLDGERCGRASAVVDVQGDWLVLEDDLPADAALGQLVRAREGCDHTIATCSARFGNAANFRGEPYLPGNDILGRYPAARS